MTPEYIFLGGILIAMGAVQTWLRHGPGAKRLDEAPPSRSSEPEGRAGREAGSGAGQVRPGGGVRSGRVWESWTAVLGIVSIALGVVLVILGVMGR